VNSLSTILFRMSDLVAEPVQEPPNVTNRGSPRPLEGVSDGDAHSCFDDAKSGEYVVQPPSTTSPASECVKSEEDVPRSQQSVTATDCLVSQGAV